MRGTHIRRNGEGLPIIGLDIDGTLADYHAWFIKFATDYFGRSFPAADVVNPLSFWRFLGLRKQEYDDCKLAYRQGGMKRSMPCLPGAGELTQHLRRKGAQVWICTTRPHMRLDNIDPDTQEWLRRNDIEYDALLYDPRGTDAKYTEMARQAKGRDVLGCAEDLGEQADAIIKHLRVPVWLRNRPYNQVYWDVPRSSHGMTGTFAQPKTREPYEVFRWNTAEELADLAENALDNWKRRQ